MYTFTPFIRISVRPCILNDSNSSPHSYVQTIYEVFPAPLPVGTENSSPTSQSSKREDDHMLCPLPQLGIRGTLVLLIHLSSRRGV